MSKFIDREAGRANEIEEKILAKEADKYKDNELERKNPTMDTKLLDMQTRYEADEERKLRKEQERQMRK